MGEPFEKLTWRISSSVSRCGIAGVHEIALNRAAKAQLRNALSNSRKLVKAILAELFGRNRS
jgi:hypothetical protein